VQQAPIQRLEHQLALVVRRATIQLPLPSQAAPVVLEDIFQQQLARLQYALRPALQAPIQRLEHQLARVARRAFTRSRLQVRVQAVSREHIRRQREQSHVRVVSREPTQPLQILRVAPFVTQATIHLRERPRALRVQQVRMLQPFYRAFPLQLGRMHGVW